MDIRLGQFQLEAPIGQGGMGVVWRGHHVGTGVRVAVKVVTRRGAHDPTIARSFRNEVRAVARLNHPAIILVLDQGEVTAEAERRSDGELRAGSPFLAMELAAGGTLERLVEPLRWPQLRVFLRTLLDALAHAHARGVVHRDLKPANVLLASDGLAVGVKLSDFGIAHALERGAAQRHQPFDGDVSTTLRYIAPEQITGDWRDQGPWTDLYGLGALTFQLVNGHPPFVGAAGDELIRAHLFEPVPALEPRLPVPDGLATWVETLLAKRVADRFHYAADAAAALSQLPDVAAGVDPTVAPPLKRGAPVELPAWRASERPPRSLALVGAGLGLYGLRPIPLINREAERDRLWAALGTACDTRTPQLVLLHGAAGNGKSRLVQWLVERAHEVGGAAVLTSNHSPIRGAPGGLPAMLAGTLRCAGLGRDDALKRVKKYIATHPLPDEDEYEPLALTELMAPLLGPAEDGEEGVRRVRLANPTERYRVVARLLKRITRRRPAILWFDDVQWGSDAIGFAGALLESERIPALVVITASDEGLRDRPMESSLLDGVLRHPAAEALSVGSLAEQDCTALVQELLHLDGELAERVQRRAGGNPMFAVQLVGDWVQRGVLVVGETGFELRPGEQGALPDDLHAMWSNRIGRTVAEFDPPEAALEALELAAALGVEVIAEEWQVACEVAGIARPYGLVESLFARRLAYATELGWAFKHNMVVESLERLAREAGRWTQHHRVCAGMLQRRHEPGDTSVAGRIGRHLMVAGELEAAVRPLLDGARERLLNGDLALAHGLFDRREAAMAEIGLPMSDPRWGEGWILRAQAWISQGRLGRAQRLAARAEAAAQHYGWQAVFAQSAMVRGHVALGWGDTRGSLRSFKEALTRFEALEVALAHAAGMTDCLTGIGTVCMWRRQLDESQWYFEAAMEILLEAGDEYALGKSLRGLGDLQQCRGNYEQAERFLRRALVCFERGGHRSNIAECINDLGETARASGHIDEAVEHYRRSVRILEAVGSESASTPGFNLGLVLLLERGDYREARRVFRQQLQRLETTERSIDLLWLHAGLLACAAAMGEWAAWDEHERFLITMLSSSGFVDEDLARCTQLAGRLAAASDEQGRAINAYRQALIQWRALRNTDRVASVAQRLTDLAPVA